MNFENIKAIKNRQSLVNKHQLKILPLYTKIFDDNSSEESQLSQISGPFSDRVYNIEFENKRKVRRFYGKNIYDAFLFSEEFKFAIKAIKKKIVIGNKNLLNSANNASQLSTPSCFSTENKYGEIDFLHLQYLNKKFDETTNNVYPVLESFKIAFPGYEFIGAEEYEFQSIIISPEILEKSREKCLNWLNKYFKN